MSKLHILLFALVLVVAPCASVYAGGPEAESEPYNTPLEFCDVAVRMM